MTRHPLLLAFLALFLFASAPLTAHADDAAKEKLVLEMLDLTGAGDLGKQVMDAMMAQFGQSPGIPPEFIAKFSELAKPQDLVNMVVPLYVKALDEETLKACIAFYKSPAGKKLVDVTPQLTADSMALGQEWGMKLVEQTQAALAAEAK